MGNMMDENKGVGTDAVEAAHAPNQAADAGGIEDMATPTSKRTTGPAFQFYPDAFLSSTKVMAMSMTERGIYITLLCACWLDGSLPSDTADLARMVGMKPVQFAKIWPHNLARCFAEKKGRLVNPRLERERQKQIDYRTKQRTAAEQRWEKQATSKPPSEVVAGASSLSLSLDSVSDSVSKERTQTPRVRASTLIKPRRPYAAWEGARVYVPQRTHDDFVALRGGDSELFTWYAAIDAQYRGEIDPDMIAFWKARYREQWPPSSAAPKSKFADWKPREAV
jgi:uncharacterized protein YdaU (DUF1376 family)